MNAGAPETRVGDADGGGRISDPELRHLGRIALAGWCLFFVWAIALIVWGVVRPDPYAQGWRLVLELAFLGRLVNIADGVAQGFSTAYLLVQSGLQDIVLLLVLYPPIVTVCEGRQGRGRLHRYLERVRRTAERHKGRVEPLGVLGLWVFVFFPFWSTGALVGGVVGYLLGLRTRLVFASVFTGHALSVLSLLFAFEWMRGVAEAIDGGLVRYLPWIVVAIVLAMAFVSSRRDRRAGDDPDSGTSDDGS